VIWIEILSRHRDVLARHCFSGPEIAVGRGYLNDLVLDDPFVSAAHLRIRRDPAGPLVAQDLASENGLFGEDGRTRFEHLQLDGDRPIRIGQTWLRVREAEHAVAPARRLIAARQSWPAILALLGAVCGIESLSKWLADTAELKFDRYLWPLLAVAAAPIVWSGGWALLSRILSGAARFERCLLLALGGLLVLSVYNELAAFAAFGLSWQAPERFSFAAMWLVLAVLVFWHLRDIRPTRLVTKGAIVAGAACLAIAAQAFHELALTADADRPVTVRRLMPPAFRLAPLRDADVFFKGARQVRKQLEELRAAAPPSARASSVADTDDD
jgi:Inner membrane component of T3SS, cytoplasmic domain